MAKWAFDDNVPRVRPRLKLGKALEEDLDHVLDHIFIVINNFNATFKIAKEAKEALEKHYAGFLLNAYIRQDSKFAQASSEGTPVFAYDPESKGALDVEAVLDEALARLARPAEAPAAPPVRAVAAS